MISSEPSTAPYTKLAHGADAGELGTPSSKFFSFSPQRPSGALSQAHDRLPLLTSDSDSLLAPLPPSSSEPPSTMTSIPIAVTDCSSSSHRSRYAALIKALRTPFLLVLVGLVLAVTFFHLFRSEESSVWQRSFELRCQAGVAHVDDQMSDNLYIVKMLNTYPSLQGDHENHAAFSLFASPLRHDPIMISLISASLIEALPVSSQLVKLQGRQRAGADTDAKHPQLRVNNVAPFVSHLIGQDLLLDQSLKDALLSSLDANSMRVVTGASNLSASSASVTLASSWTMNRASSSQPPTRGVSLVIFNLSAVLEAALRQGSLSRFASSLSHSLPPPHPPSPPPPPSAFYVLHSNELNARLSFNGNVVASYLPLSVSESDESSSLTLPLVWFNQSYSVTFTPSIVRVQSAYSPLAWILAFSIALALALCALLDFLRHRAYQRMPLSAFVRPDLEVHRSEELLRVGHNESACSQQDDQLLRPKANAKKAADTTPGENVAGLYFFLDRFGNPLHQLLSFLEMIDTQVPLEQVNNAELLDGMRQQALSMKSLVHDVSDLHKLQTGLLEFAPQTRLHLGPFCDDLLLPLHFKARQQDIALHVTCPCASLPTVIVDAHRMHQILSGLFDSILQLDRTHRGALHIDISASYLTDSLDPASSLMAHDIILFKVSIRIQGFFLKYEEVASLFNPFSASKVALYDGLTIALISQLVAILQGSISVDVTAEGTSFVVLLSLPVADPEISTPSRSTVSTFEHVEHQPLLPQLTPSALLSHHRKPSLSHMQLESSGESSTSPGVSIHSLHAETERAVEAMNRPASETSTSTRLPPSPTFELPSSSSAVASTFSCSDIDMIVMRHQSDYSKQLRRRGANGASNHSTDPSLESVRSESSPCCTSPSSSVDASSPLPPYSSFSSPSSPNLILQRELPGSTMHTVKDAHKQLSGTERNATSLPFASRHIQPAPPTSTSCSPFSSTPSSSLSSRCASPFPSPSSSPVTGVDSTSTSASQHQVPLNFALLTPKHPRRLVPTKQNIAFDFASLPALHPPSAANVAALSSSASSSLASGVPNSSPTLSSSSPSSSASTSPTSSSSPGLSLISTQNAAQCGADSPTIDALLPRLSPRAQSPAVSPALNSPNSLSPSSSPSSQSSSLRQLQRVMSSVDEKERIDAFKRDFPNLTLLVCDDSDINIKIARRMLTGFTHECVFDGSQAVENFKRRHQLNSASSSSVSTSATVSLQPFSHTNVEQPSVILMDLCMPIMSGFEATRMIRSLEVAHRLPRAVIIAVTANHTPHDRSEAAAAGCDLLLPKPFTRLQLFDCMRTALFASSARVA